MPLTRYGTAYWETVRFECGGTAILTALAGAADLILPRIAPVSISQPLHIASQVGLATIQATICVQHASYGKLSIVAPWGIAAYWIARGAGILLAWSPTPLTVQAGCAPWFWACRSALSLHVLLDGPPTEGELLVAARIDRMRLLAHLGVVVLFAGGRRLGPATLMAIWWNSPRAIVGGVVVFCVYTALRLVKLHDPRLALPRLLPMLFSRDGLRLDLRAWGHKIRQQLRLRLRGYVEALHRALINGRALIYRRGLPAFKYDEPLDRNHIRLLRLRRRLPFSGLLQADLIRIRLEDAAFQFEALSYTWDKPNTEMKTMLIGGRPHAIQPNLHNMLHARSCLFWERTVWVDAICIRQDDPVEKTAQLPLMGDIYQKSIRTVAWLGEHPDAGLVAPLVRRMLHERDMYGKNPERVLGTFLSKAAMMRPDWRAFSRLLYHSYFTRVWVFQEILLGNKLQFYVGGQYISFEDMVMALMILDSSGVTTVRPARVEADESLSDIWGYWSIAYNRRHYGKALNLPLAYLLSSYGATLDATDPRDKVFALLSVADDAAVNVIKDQVSYKKPEEQVFKETAHALLQAEVPGGSCPATAQLVLATAGMGFAGRLADLPSWVPDWRYAAQSGRTILNRFSPASGAIGDEDELRAQRQGASLYRDRRDYAAGGKDVAFEATVDDDSWMLKLRAITVDSLARLGPALKAGSRLGLGEWVKKACEAIPNSDVQTVGSETRPEMLWRTLVADWADGQHPAPAGFVATFDAWQRVTLQQEPWESVARRVGIPGVPATGEVSEMVHFRLGELLTKSIAAISGACRGRRLGVTTAGRLTLVPAGAQVGDLVCVVAGVQTPFVVRPEASQHIDDHRDKNSIKNTAVVDIASSEGQIPLKMLAGKHFLIGECYVHGIMDGEAMPARLDELQELILV